MVKAPKPVGELPVSACKEPCHWPACGGDFVKHPCYPAIRRDTIAYSIGVGVACVGLMLLVFCTGMLLKHERKVKPKPQIVPYGCYVWSDGLEQCKRGHNGAA